MSSSWYKKGLVLGIVVLFIAVGFQPAFAVEIKSTTDTVKNEDALSLIPQGRKIIYIDDDNTEGPWDGTIWHPYKRIKDGISVAENGDTVYVFNGLYLECYIEIEKSINIIGQNRDNTIIDGAGSFCSCGFKVNAFNVKIHGFTIRNCDFEHDRGFGIIIYGNHCVISGNKIINNGECGICVDCPFSNIIKNNIIKNHNQAGIYVSNSWGNCIIIRNHIESNNYGIYIFDSRINTYKQNNLIENSCNAYFMDTGLNLWVGNYWDDWDGSGPYTIKGEKYTLIGYDEYGYPIWDWVEDYEYDYSPAEKPNYIFTTEEYKVNGYLGTLDNPFLEQFTLLRSLQNLWFYKEI